MATKYRLRKFIQGYEYVLCGNAYSDGLDAARWIPANALRHDRHVKDANKPVECSERYDADLIKSFFGGEVMPYVDNVAEERPEHQPS